MPILAHSTRPEHLGAILKEGLRLPNETGKYNFNLSKKDRISFLLIDRELPKQGDLRIKLWWDRAAFILNPDYVNKNFDDFKYEYLHRKDAQLIQETGFEKIEKENDCAVPFEIVSIKNIPVEGISALVNNTGFRTDFLQNTASKMPEHMQFYTLLNSGRYERIK